MMHEGITYHKFYVNKTSGTYSETLETFGVADLIEKILESNNIRRRNVIIKDTAEGRYLIEAETPITQEMIDKLSYFQVIKFIKKDEQTQIPEGIGTEYFDYPEQKVIRDNQKKKLQELSKNKLIESAQKKILRKQLIQEFESEFGKAIIPEFEVIRELKGNAYPAFNKIYQNFHQNKNHFQNIIRKILSFYSNNEYVDKLKVTKEITSQQLYAPHQGKGLNEYKANNAAMGNLKSYWISEVMKTTGAYRTMVCQYVKSGGSYDLKIYVPEFNEINIQTVKTLMFEFRKYLKSSEPIKLDILNLLSLLKHFISNSKEYCGKVRDTIKGLHSVYQKSLGRNRATANISFLEIPNFISYENEQQTGEWLDFINHQEAMIRVIKEQGDAIQGLLAYRNFISGGNVQSFFSFSRWYSSYLMQALAKEKYWIKPFTYSILNKIFENMEDINLLEIINNSGFKAIAKAIRKSTVSLQYTPKDQRKFEIRYGLAQQLQNKSKSKEDLAAFIGEFIATYDSETAMKAEKGNILRATVKIEELNEFYKLLNQHSSKLVGALLSSYGFALAKDKRFVEGNIPPEDDDEVEEPQIAEPIE